MPQITEELIRKRSEHNNCEITTLEELSLHQQDIEKIEYLDKWCRQLKILYLQSNLIPKIENVNRLKNLEYLNLALNNVTKIENLTGCESLQKLDLTVNFVGDLLSIESLKVNEHLREIYLTGNPCTDYEGYREFVIATLPQLKWLDGKEITRSDRITATQNLPKLRTLIQEQQIQYEEQREREKRKEQDKNKPGFNSRWYTDPNAHLPNNEGGVQHTNTTSSSSSTADNSQHDNEQQRDEDEEKFMKEPISHTPESRIELHKHMAEKRQPSTSQSQEGDTSNKKKERRLERNGVMLNVNEGRYDFHLVEDDEKNQFVLDVACPRFMDTSLVDCQVHPTYVKVTIKGKILQLVLQEEVSPDQSNAQRSQTTGHLVITMPKVKPIIRPAKKIPSTTSGIQNKHHSSIDHHKDKEGKDTKSSLFLEVPDAQPKGLFDIVNDKKKDSPPAVKTNTDSEHVSETNKNDSNFIDDPDVPPLI